MTERDADLHAKSIAEGAVNNLARAVPGRPASKVTFRIVRLATIGPAVSFPHPGWGAGHPSVSRVMRTSCSLTALMSFCLVR